MWEHLTNLFPWIFETLRFIKCSIYRYITLASLWCILGSLCIAFHVFCIHKWLLSVFWFGDSEKCCIFAAWRERLIPFGTRPPFQSDGGNNHSPVYWQGSLHSITLFFFDVLSFHWFSDGCLISKNWSWWHPPKNKFLKVTVISLYLVS